MGYIAHKDGERVQTVKEHLEGTAERAGNFAEKFGKREWGYCCGMLHDIGKYSKEFQKKIQENTNDKVDHATAGAQVCKELGGYYPILSYCIAGHHAGLPDYGNTAISSSLCGRWKKKICDYQDYKDEVEIPDLDTEPITFKEDRNMDFSLGTFIRMLYSCLVDADFLDTESFMKNGDTGRNSGETMVTLQNRLKNHISEWLKNTDADTINGRRTEILSHCIKEGKQKEGIFRLTVPTGGGKTVASLAFALEHAVKNHKDRIIYVIPYTSIIEQNAQVFREILGEENVLENHYNVDYESSEEFKPMQLASENWDKPVVVTTNVQFFESLFANKSSKCRKIHNIANSVVIFDEAQMLPMDYLKPCIAMLQELVDSYSVSIVLCTATQPALDSFFSKNELIKELCVYDRSTKKSEKLLGLKDDLRSLISIKNSIVYYKTYDKVVAYDVDKQTKEEMDYMITSAVVVTCMVNGKIVIVGDGCVDMIDFDKKKVKKIVSQTECANDAVACTKDAVYYGVDSYNMNDILQKEKIQSKNNGLWKFDLQTGNKEKIREQSPKELHVLGNKLYDESLKEVRNGENK